MGECSGKIVYAGLDFGKFFCALLILLYHYFSEHGPLPGIIDEVLSLYAIAVALFMVISGFLIYNKLETIQGTNARWAVVWKQIKRILRVYLIWSIPYLIYNVCNWEWENINFSYVFWQVQGWIFKSTFYTIWFMPMLALGLILTFWLTEKLPEKVVCFLALAMYVVGALTLTYSFLGNMIPGFDLFNKFSTMWLGGSRGWLFYAFPLIMVGRFMIKVKHKMEWKIMALLSCGSVILMLIEALSLRYVSEVHTGIDMTIMMVPTVFCILGFLISIKIPYGIYCTWMRHMSVLIFMTQRLFLTVLPACFPTIFNAIFEDNIIGALIICGAVIVFSSLIIALSKRYKWLESLY